jgi:hypothetical protein
MWRIIQKESRDGWKRGFPWRRLLRAIPALTLRSSGAAPVLCFRTLTESALQFDAEITRFGRSLDGFSSFPSPPRLSSSGEAFNTPVLAAGWSAETLPEMSRQKSEVPRRLLFEVRVLE